MKLSLILFIYSDLILTGVDSGSEGREDIGFRKFQLELYIKMPNEEVSIFKLLITSIFLKYSHRLLFLQLLCFLKNIHNKTLPSLLLVGVSFYLVYLVELFNSLNRLGLRLLGHFVEETQGGSQSCKANDYRSTDRCIQV